ncbi:conserved protein of unknown function [Pseudomonas marincola]|uniref:Uncharacterized protein n=1 Tax=Pseudomonas marincola TaxID=437900 RepID=A0A653E521_9PSED|nr:conserved protein of unknown function [Pseudomonas marincola]
MNAVEIEQAITDLASQPFDRIEFPYAFLQALGNKDTTLKRLLSGATNKSAALTPCATPPTVPMAAPTFMA